MKQFEIKRSHILGISVIALVIFMLFMLQGAFEDCDKSKIYVNQYPVTGHYAVWTEGGLQQQWWGNIYEYHKTSQVEFTGGLFVFLYPTVNKDHLVRKNVVTKTDSCFKTKFTWKDSRGYEFPVYMNSRGSCFIIRTSKSGEKYRAYLGEEVSEQINRELELNND